MIGGREYLLAGRGPKEECLAQVPSLKEQWERVRVLPYGWGEIGRVIDDFGLWVHAWKGHQSS